MGNMGQCYRQWAMAGHNMWPPGKPYSRCTSGLGHRCYGNLHNAHHMQCMFMYLAAMPPTTCSTTVCKSAISAQPRLLCQHHTRPMMPMPGQATVISGPVMILGEKSRGDSCMGWPLGVCQICMLFFLTLDHGLCVWVIYTCVWVYSYFSTSQVLDIILVSKQLNRRSIEKITKCYINFSHMNSSVGLVCRCPFPIFLSFIAIFLALSQ